MNTNTEPTESDHTIKFTCAEDGKISFNSGHTVFSDLFMIGAFASTKALKNDGGNVWYGYPTDTEGLKSLSAKAAEVSDDITDTIVSLGMVLAYTDREVGNRHINNLAWLIAGMGELATNINRESQEITRTLNLTREVQS
jgi:hypothetical protein